MKRFLIAMALACVFSAPVLAGDIPSDGFASPPPARTSQTTSAAQPVSSAALSFIQAMIGLLAI